MRIPIQDAVVELVLQGDTILLVVNGTSVPLPSREVGIELVFGTRQQDRGGSKGKRGGSKPFKPEPEVIPRRGPGPGLAKAGVVAPGKDTGEKRKTGCQSLASRRKLSASLKRYHAKMRRQANAKANAKAKAKEHGIAGKKVTGNHRLNGAGSMLAMN